MAREEMKSIEPQMDELEDNIKILLLPKDPNDDRNVMIELRAGTGGSEANLFVGKNSVSQSINRFLSYFIFLFMNFFFLCIHILFLSIGELYDVYRKYISSNGWRATTIDSSAGDDGGYKSITLDVTGDSVYSRMKWEAGKFCYKNDFQ